MKDFNNNKTYNYLYYFKALSQSIDFLMRILNYVFELEDSKCLRRSCTYYGSWGMEGGGGLQATDLHRRLIHKTTSRRTKSSRRFLQPLENKCSAEVSSLDDERSIPWTTAGFTSGQPTCLGIGKTRSKRQSTVHDSITWPYLIQDKFVSLKQQSHRQESLKASFNNLSSEASVVENVDQENERMERRRLRRCRGFRQFTDMLVGTFLLGVVLLITPGLCHQDAVHITAILGESVVFNCHVEFPGEHPVPYVLQWEKKVGDTVRYRTMNLSALYS
ncbi:hypothetical protein KQX54_009960 [Cotesia glomerata]|uniref:Uncharacterized protein n=1 Tax=Cotesia glomerata TaxID=32391 RepID=A0AAV7IK39_COTGL|nr:hypothetical protein KQX54_009960 [Cotesia glomerata]